MTERSSTSCGGAGLFSATGTCHCLQVMVTNSCWRIIFEENHKDPWRIPSWRRPAPFCRWWGWPRSELGCAHQKSLVGRWMRREVKNIPLRRTQATGRTSERLTLRGAVFEGHGGTSAGAVEHHYAGLRRTLKAGRTPARPVPVLAAALRHEPPRLPRHRAHAGGCRDRAGPAKVEAGWRIYLASVRHHHQHHPFRRLSALGTEKRVATGVRLGEPWRLPG